MSLYDKASLVMIPSGYKDDKLYSIKPTSGDGDFTFSRDGSGASPATRVNSAGLIEKGRTNLLLQSNSFDTTWTQTDISTLTSGQSGYDGTNDAWLVEKSASSNAYLRQNISSIGVRTFSLYAKSGTLDGVLIQTRGASTKSAQFDLSTGTLGTAANNIDAKIEDIGSGWYRCSVSVNDSAITQVRVFICDDGTTVGTTAGSIYIQDAQLEKGLVATSYIETTTSAVSAGLLGDMPRLDYSGGASCPSLLLEPSRVNLVTQSEYIGSWGTLNASVIDNATTSPEGVTNAAALVDDATSGSHYVQSDVITHATGEDMMASVFLKKGTRTQARLRLSGGTGTAYFNLEDGSVVSESGATATIEDYGNGWYRCAIFDDSAQFGTGRLQVMSAVDGDSSYVGDGTEAIYIYGAQYEHNTSYPTSYIPTYGSATARAVDFNSDNDLVNTDIAFGANDDFTLFYEGSFNDLSSTSNMIMGGGRKQLGASYKNYWWAQNATSMRIVGEGETLMANTSMSLTDNTNHKLLVKRSGSVVDFFVDGSKLTTTQNTPNTAFTFRSLGWAYTNSVYKVSGNIKQALIFDSALTDAECISLTTI